MPAPIRPAPSTPIFLQIGRGTLAGRRAPLLSSPIDRNNERIIAAASFDRRMLAKYLLSTASARSIGSCRPSNTLVRIAFAAG